MTRVNERTTHAEALPRALLTLWRVTTLVAFLATTALAARQSTYPELFGRYSVPLFVTLVAAAIVSTLLVTARRTGLLAAIYRTRTTIAAITLSTAATVALLELGVRIVDPLGASYFEAVKQYELDKVADPLLIFRHRPSATFDYAGVEARFNELGLRDAPIRPKQPGEYRILFLGDSVLFGWGVREEDTFGLLMERVLAERLDHPVSVINTGVGGYNTQQQLRFLTKHGLDMQPDAVLLLYVPNDVQVHEEPFDPWSHQSLGDKPPDAVMELMLRRSWLYRLVVHITNGGRLGPRLGGPGSPGWRASMDALKEIQNTCAERGIPFIPIFYRLEPGDSSTLLAAVRDAVQPLTLHDTAPWFVGVPVREYTNSVIDAHPNDRAHAVMARAIAGLVESRTARARQNGNTPSD